MVFLFSFSFTSGLRLKGILNDVFWEDISDGMLTLQEGMKNKGCCKYVDKTQKTMSSCR